MGKNIDNLNSAQAVLNFYQDIVHGNAKLQDIGISDAPCPAQPRAGVASPMVITLLVPHESLASVLSLTLCAN